MRNPIRDFFYRVLSFFSLFIGKSTKKKDKEIKTKVEEKKEMIWNYSQYFSRNEAWGEPDRICGFLVLTLGMIREATDWPMVIHYGTQGIHTEGSYHYRAMAVDWHFITSQSFKDQAKRLILVLDKLQLAEFVGFGIYPQWTAKGFHLDVRGFRARWGRLDGKYVSWQVILNNIK